MKLRRLGWVGAGLALVWGCGTGSGKLEPEAAHDASAPSDASAVDASAPSDAASAVDAGATPEETGSEAAGTCDPSTVQGQVTTPSPLVSVGQPVAASAGVQAPEALVDGLYRRTACSFGAPTTDAPEWVAVQIGSGPDRLLVAWVDRGYVDYNLTSGGAPAGYRIETSADSTDGSDGTWQTQVTVTDNPVRTRAHSVDFAGQVWLRLVVTAGTDVELDELAIHDISSAGTDLPEDTWFFMGDSITKGAFERGIAQASMFDAVVHEAHPSFDPVMVPGGIGGELATDGARHIEQWLELNPDILHIGIAYGTNDAWGNQNAASVGFESSLVTIIEAVLAAGRVPVLARIPYATAAHDTLPDFNAIIDELQVRYCLPLGPDLYTWFQEHPDELSSDGVHPSPPGYVSINRLWAEAMAALYPAE